MADWERVKIDGALLRPPEALVSAPALPSLDLLPFTALGWERFEKLQLRMMLDVLGLRDPRQYGDPGQDQQAIDIIATAADGAGVALQSKDYKSFTVGDLKAAVARFLETDRPFPVDELIIGVSSLVRRREIIAELRRLQGELAPTRLELWDAQRLADLLRSHPDIVAQFFTRETAAQFCGEFEVSVPRIPSADARIISEAVTMAPEEVTGAQALLDEAKTEADPTVAISLIEKAQEKLREAGFDAYASRHDPGRAELLVQVGREHEAARQILDEVWEALDRGRTGNAQITFERLRAITKLLPNPDTLSEYKMVGRIAFEVYMHPLGALPEPSSLQAGSESDTARLLLMAGETALAMSDSDWLRSASAQMSGLAANRAIPAALRVRLRLLVAEADDDWTSLLDEARRRRLSSTLTPLIAARYARYSALRQDVRTADDHWEQAASLACLARQWDAAGTWLLSKRAHLSNWNPLAGNDNVALEIALGEQPYPEPSVIPLASRAYEEAHEQIRQDKTRSAAIAAQRALRDAVASGDWAGERKARDVLATVMQAAGELERAAVNLARAGESKKIEAIGKAHPNQFIDIVGELDAKTYWNVGSAYRLLSAQADVVPDDRVDDIVAHIISDIHTADAGELVDVQFFASSRFNNAMRALAAFGLRLREADADAALTFFESQPPLDQHRSRYHDEDEAVAVARIARAHLSLAPRAIAHLVPLLARNSQTRKNAALEALEDYPELSRAALREVTEGRDWALEMLAYADPDDIDESAAAAALERLTTPLTHIDGVYSVGSSSAVGDSLHLANQPQDALVRAVRELMSRAKDPHLGGLDRGNYLSAATNIVGNLADDSKTGLFPDAVDLAEKQYPSAHDDIQRRLSHPLGAVRYSPSGSDRRGQATLLASRLATSDDERAQVRRLAYRLLGSDSDFYPTQALQNLGAAVKDDVAFLAGQGWAMRCLAAMLWAEHGGPPHVGARLAADEDVRVRQALASELADAAPDTETDVLRAQLASDPSFRVRRALLRAG